MLDSNCKSSQPFQQQMGYIFENVLHDVRNSLVRIGVDNATCAQMRRAKKFSKTCGKLGKLGKKQKQLQPSPRRRTLDESIQTFHLKRAGESLEVCKEIFVSVRGISLFFRNAKMFRTRFFYKKHLDWLSV